MGDSNLYLKTSDGKLLAIVIYVDNIIFSSDLDQLTFQLVANMKAEFEMSMHGEFYYFLGL